MPDMETFKVVLCYDSEIHLHGIVKKWAKIPL